MSLERIKESIKKTMGEMSDRQARIVAITIIDDLVTAMKTDGSYTLPKFGTFKVAERPARKGFNPRNGEKIKIAASSTVRFKASPTLRKIVRVRKKAVKKAA